MTSRPLLPQQWEAPQLVVQDSTLAEVPALQAISHACNYVNEWTGWKVEDHPGGGMLATYTEGDLPPNGTKELFRLQSIRLRDTGQLIGYLKAYHGFPTPDTFFVTDLTIDPRFQGQGYGQAFVRGLSDAVRRCGAYAQMRLIADLKNWPALRFWVQSGFERIVSVLGDKVYSAEASACMILEKRFVSHSCRIGAKPV